MNSEPVRIQLELYQFYNEIFDSGIVTFGDGGLEVAGRMNKTNFIGNVIYKTDQYGMLTDIHKNRKKNKKLSRSCTKKYNFPDSIIDASINRDV